MRTNTRIGRQRILGLLNARDSGQRLARCQEVLGRGRRTPTSPAVHGWAVTSLMARRFPHEPALFDLVVIDEASQSSGGGRHDLQGQVARRRV